MTNTTIFLAMFAMLFAAHAGFACEYPPKVSIANGATATKDEMIESQANVKKYVADMQAYLDCIVDEEKATRALMEDLTPDQQQQREEMLDKKYNAAVEQMEKAAADFNAEVQAYKARNGT